MNLITRLGLLWSQVFAIALTGIVAGCASLTGESASNESAVLQRAQARWDALVVRDFATAYKFMTPAYRAVVPQNRYANQFQGPVAWDSAKAVSAKCEEMRCTVQIELSFRLMLPGHFNRQDKTSFDETWVLEEGQWFKFESL